MTPKQIVVLIIGCAIGCLTAVVALAWQVEQRQGEDEQRRCELAVEARADNRAMWEFLINLSPPAPDDPVGQAFIVELDRRLPHLRCDDGIPTPISTEDS